MTAPKAPKEPPRLLLEAVREELEAEYDLGALRDQGLDPDRVLDRMAAKVVAFLAQKRVGLAEEGLVLKEYRTPAGTVDLAIQQPDGGVILVEVKRGGLPDSQRFALAAMFTLDPEGRRGLPSGTTYKSMVTAGFPDKWDSKKRSGQMQGVFELLMKKGLADVGREGDKRVARITPKGVEYLKTHEADLLARFAEAHEGVEKFF